MDLLITFLASILIWCLYLALLILWALKFKIKKEVVLHAILASFVAWGISEMIKNLLPSMRPFNINNGPIYTLTKPFDNAFPSGHAAAAFGLAMAIWFHNRKVGLVFLIGAMLVGVGRVLANVHFPIDITVGSLIGILVAYVLRRIHFTS
ncbi:MAG: phosphatase PAP2 family protein [Candidatus Microgenomates bacterium]|jgi:undecaprenyl-diphosphatase